MKVYYGIVTGETIIGANFVRDFFAGIRDIIGGRSGSYEKVLREAKDTAIDYATAATQIAGRQAARHKLPLFAATEGIIYPVHLSMEQCSSQATAEFKASLVGGGSLIDLTGGFGVDCLFMSRRFDTATYVERNTALCSIMQHNKSLLDGDNITVVNAEATEYLTSCKTVDMIYLDPARRDTHGSKTVLITQCEPDLTAINGTLLDKARKVMVKLSPMLDLTAATNTLEGVDKAFIVSVGGECKELLLILDRHASGGTEITAVNLVAQGNEIFTFTRHEEETATPAYANEVETYLFPCHTIRTGKARAQHAPLHLQDTRRRLPRSLLQGDSRPRIQQARTKSTVNHLPESKHRDTQLPPQPRGTEEEIAHSGRRRRLHLRHHVDGQKEGDGGGEESTTKSIRHIKA